MVWCLVVEEVEMEELGWGESERGEEGPGRFKRATCERQDGRAVQKALTKHNPPARLLHPGTLPRPNSWLSWVTGCHPALAVWLECA